MLKLPVEILSVFTMENLIIKVPSHTATRVIEKDIAIITLVKLVIVFSILGELPVANSN